MKNIKELAQEIFEKIGSDNLDYIEDILKDVYKEIANIITADDYIEYKKTN